VKLRTILCTMTCILGMTTSVLAYDVEDLSDFSNADIMSSELTDLEGIDPYQESRDIVEIISSTFNAPAPADVFSPEQKEALDIAAAALAQVEADKALADLTQLVDLIEALTGAGGNPAPFLGPVYKGKILVTVKAWAKYSRDTCAMLKARHKKYIYSASRIRRDYYKGVMRDYCRMKVYMKVSARNHYPVYDPYVVSE
jgi:hypothetical protein